MDAAIASVVLREDGTRLNLTGQQRARIERTLAHLSGVLSGESLMLPSRAHPVVDRALVEVAIPDPVVALDFRMGFDAATLQLIGKRISRTRKLLHSTAVLSQSDVDDVCASFSLARTYLAWVCGVGANTGDEMKDKAREGNPEAATWLWLGVVIHELACPE